MILIQKQKYSKGKKEKGLLDVSGTRLANALGIKIYTNKIKCKKNPDNLVINWGMSKIDWWLDNDVIINSPNSVGKACDKIKTFTQLASCDIPIPAWTHLKEVAQTWFDKPKVIVFCRTLLSASKGKGIVIARKPEELVEAPLYTLYIPKDEEYRFHIAFNKVIHIQKKLKLSVEELETRDINIISPLIRNSSNGYVFSSNLSLELEEDGSYVEPKYFVMTEHSIYAIQALGLDFGAVDLIVSKDGKVYILEVNTAPGIEGITLEKYVNAIKENLNN